MIGEKIRKIRESKGIGLNELARIAVIIFEYNKNLIAKNFSFSILSLPLP